MPYSTARQTLLNEIKDLSDNFEKIAENSSNFKFMILLRSRLLDELIPLEDANKIVNRISFDLSDVNEDDEYLGTVATDYAEFCGKVYHTFKKHNFDLDSFIHQFAAINLFLDEEDA